MLEVHLHLENRSTIIQMKMFLLELEVEVNEECQCSIYKIMAYYMDRGNYKLYTKVRMQNNHPGNIISIKSHFRFY